MKASETKLLAFLKKSPQFVIPIYQRTYSWTKRECTQLWNDVLRAGRNPDISAHFIGSIVYIQKDLYQVSSQSPLLVIDGQQRLTTISLLLEALARELGDEEPVDGFSTKKIRHYYLLNSLEDGERQFKLLLTQTDKQSLLAIVQQKPQPHEYSIRIKENFEFFQKQIKALKKDLTALCLGLAKLMIVDIALSRDQDNPQLIFESMNSTGRELSQADLIRNFVLMGLEPAHQKQLYEDHWRPMEVEFGQEAYGKYFDYFIRHYLTVKTGQIPNIRAVYDAFKEYAKTKNVADTGVDTLVSDIHAFASYYCAMALGAETDPKLKDAFRDLQELKVEVAYPFLLEVYHDYKSGIVSGDDLLAIVRLAEAYVFRRAICGIPTNSLNKTFANAAKNIRKDHYLQSIQAHFLMLPSYRRFPNDNEFIREIKTRDLYNFRSRSYWLRRMENLHRKVPIDMGNYTIEHIMPQNENLSQAWKNELGPDWKRVHDRWLHTLGNLTLTGYNSEYSDHPFKTKRDMENVGFRYSPLHLNAKLGTVDTWDERAILARADKLASLAVDVWTAPKLSDDVLAQFKPTTARGDSYSIDDYPYLKNEPNRSLFEAFRKQVLLIDPCVTEEFRKLYIAYKAETNFVDVVPQASRLRLSLNMRFHEIDDPRGMCKDISNLGRWGNGDVEIGLSNFDDLPYIMGLVRQSFDLQMGNGESAL